MGRGAWVYDGDSKIASSCYGGRRQVVGLGVVWLTMDGVVLRVEIPGCWWQALASSRYRGGWGTRLSGRRVRSHDDKKGLMRGQKNSRRARIWGGCCRGAVLGRRMASTPGGMKPPGQ